MDERFIPANDSGGASGEARLESWKRIAAYLKRDVTTVQRWERREAMPVHRHQHEKQGSVYAYRSELDAWWGGRGARLSTGEAAANAPVAAAAVADEASEADMPRSSSSPRFLRATVAGALLLIVLVFVAGRAIRHWHRDGPAESLAHAGVTRLTINGTEHAAAISRDGRFVAYLATADGRMDAWLTEVGTALYRNLTNGQFRELSNPSIRTIGFSPDGSFISVWTRRADGARPEDIQLVKAPSSGGPVAPFLRDAAEVDWSRDGKRLVFHTTAPGDPLFVRDAAGATAQQIYVAPPGVHCHFPTWSADGAYIYFVRGEPPDHWDIWRVHPDGAALERMTTHNSRVTYPVVLDAGTLAYLANDADGSGPWIHVLDTASHRTHRVSTGIGRERYTSLSTTADGRRLAATLASSHADVWRVAIDAVAGVGAGPAPQTVASPAAPVFKNSLAPRYGPGYFLFIAESGGKRSLYKQVGQTVTEIWNDAGAEGVGAPAISPDGGRIALTVTRHGATELTLLDSDGGHATVVAGTLALRGDLSFTPDGRAIIGALVRGGEPRLAKIPLDGSPPQAVTSEYSQDPVWSTDGQYFVYSGADVGTTFPVRAAGPDGRPAEFASLILTRGARRVAFAGQSGWLVILRGDLGHKNFWLWDPKTVTERQLTQLPADVRVGDFDVSPDGTEILFERVQDSSSIALIDRSHAS